MRISTYWLVGTYLLFLTLGNASAVQYPWRLTAFILATVVLFVSGYMLSCASQHRARSLDAVIEAPTQTSAVPTFLIVAGSTYYFAVALGNMFQFGVASLGAITKGISDPGGAYFAKFDAYEQQLATGSSNPVLQIATLVSFLSATLPPLLIIYWDRLSTPVKLFGISSLGLYGALYLAIGTLVGLGNLVLLIVTGIAVKTARRKRDAGGPLRNRRRATAVVILVAVGFSGYMAYNQSERIVSAGGASHFQPNPVAEQLFGREFARGVSATVFYPTHGYEGLAYNLNTNFEWTYGRGSSRGLDGYLEQYGLGPSQFEQTYPARTARTTGWDAGLYWSTIYPWLASDLTYMGAILFMGIIGWWLARLWHEAVLDRSVISTVLMTQMVLLIAFVPANNQTVIGRGPLLCFTALAICYGVLRMKSGRSTRFVSSPKVPGLRNKDHTSQ